MERIVGDLGERRGAGRASSRCADGSADIDGLTLVTDVNEQFGLHIDEDTYTTIGGYVLGRLGRRARVGDTHRGRRPQDARRSRSTGCECREGVAVDDRRRPARVAQAMTPTGAERLTCRCARDAQLDVVSPRAAA